MIQCQNRAKIAFWAVWGVKISNKLLKQIEISANLLILKINYCLNYGRTPLCSRCAREHAHTLSKRLRLRSPPFTHESACTKPTPPKLLKRHRSRAAAAPQQHHTAPPFEFAASAAASPQQCRTATPRSGHHICCPEPIPTAPN